MERHLLSKSSFIKGNQCSKALYLYKNHYDLKDPLTAEQKALFARGNSVGLLARSLFPGGVDASPESPYKYRESVAKTAQLIERGEKVIYEASFQFEQVLAAVDILVKKDDLWVAYEVKSSTKISPTYLLDSSLQHWVIINSGLQLNDFFLVNINNQYIRDGKIDVQKLFIKTSVKSEALKNFDSIREKVQELKTVLTKRQIPEIAIGEHCFMPYSCDFMGICWKNVPENSVFDLAMTKKGEQFKMYHEGIERLTDVPDNYTSLNKNAQMQIKSYKNGEIVINRGAIKAFVHSLAFPLYFMDFETIMPAVPKYNGTHPYQNLPFQYSIHSKQQKNADVKHVDFLAEVGIDPRKPFVEKLLTDLGDKGDILVYNITFERSILNAMKKDFSEYSEKIDKIIARLKDLMEPFKEKHYYHPAMKGLYSIKSVLPALVPELKYDNLKIGQGSVAMIAFEELQKETDMFKIIETREALLEYCKMDTYAMVRILEVLEKSIDLE